MSQRLIIPLNIIKKSTSIPQNQTESNMSMRKQSVDVIATEVFAEYTADKMIQFLSQASDQLKKVARESMHINLRGGIGNGKDGKYKACYLTNPNYNQHLRGYHKFKRFVSVSNVFSIQAYRRNSCVLNHIIVRLDYYHDQTVQDNIVY